MIRGRCKHLLFTALVCGVTALPGCFGGNALAESLTAGTGKYEFLLPLGPKCLNGAFSVTVNSYPGIMTLAVDPKGLIHGQLTVNGQDFVVSGRHKVLAGTASVTLVASAGTAGSLRLSAKVLGSSLTGTSKASKRLLALTGPLIADLSDSDAMIADLTLDLATDARGTTTGSGTALVCGAVIPVTAKGRSANGKATLTLKGNGFTFSGRGIPLDDAFTLSWNSRSSGASAIGQGLSVALVNESDAGPKPEIVLSLPALSIDPPTPSAGSTATVTVDLAGATQITLSAVGSACGAFGFIQQSGSHLSAARTVGDFGDCVLSADLATPSGAKHFASTFTVEPTDLLLPALEVLDGVFHAGGLPPTTGSADDPNIASIDAPGSLINGGTAELRIHLTDPEQAADVSNVLVEVDGAAGFAGYYEVPATRDGDDILVSLRLAAELTAPSTERDQARFASQSATNQEIGVKLRNRFGQIGTGTQRSFPVHEVGAGEVKVSVSWNTATDVDLHVVEPTGFEIYYNATSSPSGGRLDLDSNPGCGIDGVNNENVVWGTNAPAGEYIVRVDFYDDCDPPPKGATYTVTQNVCGDVKSFTGSFGVGSDDSGGRGSGTEVTRFTLGCGKKRVRGRATYEDFAQTDTGLASTSTMLPIRFARVEVHRDSDGLVLGKGDTRQDGTFDITFDNNGTPGYYVEVKADQKNAIVNQYVVDKNEKIYSARSDGTINEQETPDKTNLTIEALASASGPAFNAFDLGVEAASTMRLVTGSTPRRLKWWWQPGDRGLCDGITSCFNKAKTRISICSEASDKDDYDDLVLLHEFGHFFNFTFGGNVSLGGEHSALIRSNARLAWSEGSATFFGNYVRRTPVYIDTLGTSIGNRYNIEDLSLLIPTGTSDGNQTGRLSETVVAAILWDIVDATTVASDKGKDQLTDPNALFGAWSYLGSSFFHDRGATGQDLVDFLDGWFCVGNANQDKLEDIVFEIHFFDYDFTPPNSGACRGTLAGRTGSR